MKLRFSALAILICMCMHQGAFAVLQSYEGFDYSNTGSNLLAGANGGSGWGGPWTFFGTTIPTQADNGHRLSQDDVSLDSAAFPFSPVGDRVISKGIGPGNNTWADRTLADPFNFSTEGEVRYFSFLFQKDTGAAAAEDNMEFNLWSTGVADPLTQVRFGSTSGERFFINNATTADFEDVTVGQTYFVVLKLESHATTNDMISALTYAPSETVPNVEPATWEKVFPVGLGATITGMRLWIGVQTTGEYDEIRMGTTWADVAVAPAFPPGDYNQNGIVDAADYVIWRENPGSQFGPGDYTLWRQNFGSTSASGTGGAAVPEPVFGSLLLIGLLLILRGTTCTRSRLLK